MKNWMRANKGFIMFLMLFGLFRTAVADWNPIPSGSMHPNLLEGDVVFVNRLAYDLKVPLTDVVVTHLGEPQRGDIVTFSSPKDKTRLIKRVIALPGDTISMRDDQLTINGKPASYSMPADALEAIANVGQLQAVQLTESAGGSERRIQLLPQVASAKRDFPAMQVPAGQYLMLGDNRNNSVDSRYIGLVPRELLIGRAERVLVSADIQGNWLPRTERFGMALGD
ncbi:signal peptidase I [Pseudoduganella namucuonensis]|uniref:Signal peptidase I n=1 Tax=Pseudoduganella namucuonensis TaxID=1035707 RepID=A0A1I7EY24_9BURK|nr:signal peptidase I [Pseudoduganella namucuonensis]SFU28789.1 signal peptidase I [Pseudoduganella namucuonensis]